MKLSQRIKIKSETENNFNLIESSGQLQKYNLLRSMYWTGISLDSAQRSLVFQIIGRKQKK